MKKLNVLLVSLFFAASITAVAQQDDKFPIGSFISGAPNIQNVMNSYDSSGMNTIFWYARESNKAFLSNYDVIPMNFDATDWINHYATGFYSKWESEENQTNLSTIGVKHKYGSYAIWQGIPCWSTNNLTGPKDSLMYGPHYYQAKKYRRWSYANVPFYTARFRMAFNKSTADPDDPVCVIKVVDRYEKMKLASGVFYPLGTKDTVFLIDTLKVSDFPSNGSFKYFDFQPLTYSYSSDFLESPLISKNTDATNEGDTIFVDSFSDTGIQFWVDWLGNNALGILYIDHVEVFDNSGWNEYVFNSQRVVDSIEAYVQRYSDWDNIKYWYAHDEPNTIDAFIPIRTVDSVVRANNSVPLITYFWETNTIKNGESIYQQFYEEVQPQKLMFDAYPYHAIYPEGLENLRSKFQLTHTLQPDFYYVGQGFGVRDSATNNWCAWIKPTPEELKATVMMGLAHGTKGLFFWNYDSYYTGICGPTAYFDGIVGFSPDYEPSDLWYLIRDNFVPRLAGKLGQTLLGLNYTGSYIDTMNLGTQSDQFNIPSGYLTLFDYNPPYHWHVGFLNDKVNTDNKYFLIINLRTNNSRTAEIAITNNTPFYNVAVRDVEDPNNINTTISQESLIFYPEVDSGDGYLIQVAPVVKYGGNLAYNDTIKTGTVELTSDMTIEDGVNLVINTSYIARDTITLHGTGFITGEGYFYLEDDGDVIINDWDRSVFRSRSGNYPKLIWGNHPTYEIDSFYIYKKYQSQNFQLIGVVDETTFEYTDATVTIIIPLSEPESAEYYVVAKSKSEETDQSNTVNYFVGMDDMGKMSVKTEVYDFKLSQNYPNPYNPETIINYSIAELTDVRLSVYDILGREIKILVNEKKEPGNYEVSFDADNLSSGIYIYRIETKSFTKSQKMVLMK